MKFLHFSLRSKHVVPPAEPGSAVKPLYSTPVQIGEFGELSWYQTLPPEEHYDGGSFLPADGHNDDAPLASGFQRHVGALSMSTGTQDHPIDLSCGAPLTSIMPTASLASRSDRSVLSSESAHSTLHLSAYSSCFPVVPPTSDQMIEALSLGLERDYHEALFLSGASSNSSSASSSRSDLFDGCTGTSSYLESGRTTPDSEWGAPEHDSRSLPEPAPPPLAGELDLEGPTVRLVSSSKYIPPDPLPSLRKWGAASS